MEQQAGNNISRRQTLKKLGGIFAGGIFANLILPTEGMSPSGKSNISLPQPEQAQTIQQTNAIRLNETIPCDSRTALRDFLEQHGYICDYDWSDRLDSTALSPAQKQQLSQLLKPIIQDSSNTNSAAYYLLHHLIKHEIKKLSLDGIDDSNHKQLIQQLKGILPQGPKPYTHRYVDPMVIKLLDESNTQSLISLTYEPQSSSNHIVEVHDDAPEPLENTYEVDGVIKYSHTYARQLLAEHNIGLRSSNQGIKDLGNNRSSNRSSLVGINASSIDGVIALIEDVRQRRNYNQKEYITGGTEFGIHNPGPNGHEGGRKIDLGESLLVLILLLEQGITQVMDYSGQIQLRDYEYIFNYHKPDRHLDVKIEQASTTYSSNITQKAAN